jgi:bifunctional UDP-N-acetylglucosamine pyrophosphorylase/glucosamine-1-phosphate N-acetyltransferase
MLDLHVVILAAGKGTRMKSSSPKVLHRVAGKPMIAYVLDTARGLSPETTTLVTGHMKDALQQALAGHGELRFVTQEPQLGTGHALLQTAPLLEDKNGVLVLLSGDVPLLTHHTLNGLLRRHEDSGAAATVLTAILEQPHGYGRIVRRDGHISAIVEERDASPAQKAIREINSGIFAFSIGPLFAALRSVAARNAQGEYYLTDLVSIFRHQNLGVETVTVEDANEIRGINSRPELAEASRIVRQTKNNELMASGVTLEDPATTYVDAEVVVGADTVIHPNVYLEGKTKIGAGCEIHSGTRIISSTLGDGVIIRNYCVIADSRLASRVQIGPFAHLRPGSDLGESVHIGNFVELKKVAMGAGSKAGHLTYLGDAIIGEKVNVGAGTITCNYDGEKKHQTVIEDGAFIGSDTQLVAPVKVGRGAYIGSGTTVREDVPAGALGVSAGKQRNIEGWRKKSKT